MAKFTNRCLIVCAAGIFASSTAMAGPPYKTIEQTPGLKLKPQISLPVGSGRLPLLRNAVSQNAGHTLNTVRTNPLILVGTQSAPHVIRTELLHLVGAPATASTTYTDSQSAAGVQDSIRTDPLTLVGAQSAPHVIRTGLLHLIGAPAIASAVSTDTQGQSASQSATGMPTSIRTKPLILVGAQSAPHVIHTGPLRLVGNQIAPTSISTGLEMQIGTQPPVGVQNKIRTKPLRLVGAQSSPHVIQTDPLILTGRRY